MILGLCVSGVREIVSELWRRQLILVLERPVLSLIFPRSVGDGRSVTVSGDFLAELENGHTNGHNKAEERELQSVPGFQTKYSDGQRNQSHRLQKDEHQNRNDDFLQLGSAGLIDGTALAELDVEGELIVLDVSRAHLHRGVQWQFEGHVVRSQVGLHGVEKGSLPTSGHFLDRARVACNFHRVRHLEVPRDESRL